MGTYRSLNKNNYWGTYRSFNKIITGKLIAKSNPAAAVIWTRYKLLIDLQKLLNSATAVLKKFIKSVEM